MKGIVFPILLIGILSLSACGGLTTTPEGGDPPQELKLPLADMEIIDNKVVWVGERNWEGESPFRVRSVQVILMPSGRTIFLTYEEYLNPDTMSRRIGEEGAEWAYIPSWQVREIEYMEQSEANNTKLPDGTYIWTHFLLSLGNHYPELYTVLTESGKETLRLQLNEALEAMEPYKTNEISPFKYAVSEAKLAGVDDKHLTLLFGEEVVSDGH